MTEKFNLTRRAALALMSATTAVSALPAFAQTAASTEITDMSVGSEDAPITMIEYASFTCPHCANFHSDVYPSIKENYIDTGKVRMIYRGIYFDRLGLWADMMARCGGPDRYFGVTALIYDKQQEWTSADSAVGIVDNLYAIGRLAGMSDAEMQACMQDNENAQAMVTFSSEHAENDGINATPSFVINGEPVANMAYSGFVDLFERLLAE